MNTRPPAVGVTPATTGAGAANFQRTAPVSASKAVIQPLASLAGPWISPMAEPNQIAPADGTVGSSASCTLAHQSTAPVYNVFSVGWNAAPFHSLPP